MKLLARASLLLPLALSLAACTGTVTSGDATTSSGAGGSGAGAASECAPGAGGAAIPDPSFEEDPSQWLLAPQATLDDQGGACESERSIRLKLDKGLGSMEATRSAYLEHVELNHEYTVTFHYRHERCVSAELAVQVGDFEKAIPLEGTDATWKTASMVVTFQTTPAFVFLQARRMGAYDEYQAPEHDDNLVWVDAFAIR